MDPVEIVPPVLSMATFDTLNVLTLSAMKLLVTFKKEMLSVFVVNLAALSVSAYTTAVLRELATIVLMLK